MSRARVTGPIAAFWLTACGSASPRTIDPPLTPLPSVDTAAVAAAANPQRTPVADGAATPCEGGTVHTWSCPMHPQVRSDREGACSICAMDLVEDVWTVPQDVAAASAQAWVTASGLATCVVRAGHGVVHPTPTDRVAVRYAGWTTDGTMLDSSRGRPEMVFPLGGLIPGWLEGVGLMVEGEVRRLWIPAELAYGNRPGRTAGMLVFDVELVRIVPSR